MESKCLPHARKISKRKFSCVKRPGQYYCRKCGFRTVLSVSFKRHLQKYHSGVEESETEFVPVSYLCAKCGFVTYSSLRWLRHVTAECIQNITSGRYFPDTTVVPQVWPHNYIQWEDKIEHSEKCDKKLEVKTVSAKPEAKPISILETVSTFVCLFCNFKTNDTHNAVQHSHNGEYLPQTNDARTAVQLASEKVKVYTCQKCPVMSTYKHIVERHEKDVHGLVYRCLYCSYQTEFANNVYTHMMCHIIKDSDGNPQ